MKFSVRFQEVQNEVRSVLQNYCLLMSTVFVVDRFSNMRWRKIPKFSWLIAANATSGIIANVSQSLKIFLKIIDWAGLVHIVNLVLPFMTKVPIIKKPFHRFQSKFLHKDRDRDFLIETSVMK